MKVCSHCGSSRSLDMFSKCSRNRDGLRYDCKVCEKVYRDAHKNESQSYRNSHKLETSEYDATRYTTHTEEIKKRAYDWWINHKSRVAIRNREWRESHKEQQAAGMRAWQIANPDKVRRIANRRRALKRNAVRGFMPEEPLQELIKIYGTECIVPDCHKVLIIIRIIGHDCFSTRPPGGQWWSKKDLTDMG
jgi:hypothetical protein